MFEFYKKEQGKYTRLLTMLGGGLIVALGAYWLAQSPMYQIAMTLGLKGTKVLVAQAIGASVVLLAGGYLTFWISYLKPSTGDFFIAVEGEMKKVSWSNRKEVIGSTKVVIFTLAGMGMLLFMVDLLFMLLFSVIGVLQITGIRELFGLGGGG
ncbi:MAG: preprotein translocase subunit SecE [Phycisphaerae bacterium]|nr:preprotein translocase subunit SecE [Phycisphaerae bacterium]